MWGDGRRLSSRAATLRSVNVDFLWNGGVMFEVAFTGMTGVFNLGGWFLGCFWGGYFFLRFTLFFFDFSPSVLRLFGGCYR